MASALELRASIASKVDLPTPEPAKMPMRWPWQQVVKALIARTPRSSLAPTRARVVAGGGAALMRIGAPAPGQAGPSHPSARQSRSNAAQPGFARIDGSRVVLEIGAGAQRNSVQRTQWHHQGAAIAKADHFAGNLLAVSEA